jgi:probable addiction module antidote protein
VAKARVFNRIDAATLGNFGECESVGVADFLNDEKTIAEYLNMALEDPNPEMLLLAVKNIARARGMAQLAEDAGLGRESLYKALSEGAKPRYDTVLKVVRALGVKLHAEPIHA